MKGATAVASGTEINFHIHIQPLRLYTTRQRVVDVIAHATGPLPPWKHNIPSPRRWEQGRWQQRAAGETGRGVSPAALHTFKMNTFLFMLSF